MGEFISSNSVFPSACNVHVRRSYLSRCPFLSIDLASSLLSVFTGFAVCMENGEVRRQILDAYILPSSVNGDDV